MSNELEKLFFELSSELVPNVIKGMIALKNEDEYVEIKSYDGIKNSINYELSGISFEISTLEKNFEEYDDFYIKEIDVEKFKYQYWWAFHDIKAEKVYIYIKKIYKPLINEREEMAIMVYLFFEDISDIMNQSIERVFIELTDYIYQYHKTFTKKDLIEKFLNNFIRLTKISDSDIYNHSLRVADIATIISKAMPLNQEQTNLIRNAAIIHDIGKLWQKTGMLENNIEKTENETNKMYLEKLEEIFLGNNFMNNIVKIAKLIYERENGTGPYGLRGPEIPIEAKILSVSNAFDSTMSKIDKPNPLQYSLSNLKYMVESNLLSERVVEVATKILPTFYGGIRNLDIFSSMGYGREVYIQDKYEKEKLHKALINSSIGNILNIKFVEKDLDLKTGTEIEFVLDIGGIVEDYNAKIISKSEENYTILIESKSSKNSKLVRIVWYKNVNIFKIDSKVDLKNLKINPEKSYTGVMRVIGGSSLNFSSENEFRAGQILLLNFEYKGENVNIIGIIKSITYEKSFNNYFLEYLDMGEKHTSAIYRAIFKRQIDLRMKNNSIGGEEI